MDRDTRKAILDLIRGRGSTTSLEVQKKIGLSRQAVHYHIKQLIKDGLIHKIGRTKGSRYVPAEEGAPIGQRIRRILINEDLEEHKVFMDLAIVLNLARTLIRPAYHIVEYAFTELLNNAIEHSSTQRI